ncbi:MAG: hypothetical protein JOZ01_08695, partial [Candidatus Eremiobacteraeota bacterium]|nr:hypothetical protein [Candidatus Eremiobacteraeota bacterium]
MKRHLEFLASRRAPPVRVSCGAFALMLAVLPAAAAAKGLELADLRQVVTVSAPAIAADGSRIVYVRSRIDWKNDRRNAELVLVD